MPIRVTCNGCGQSLKVADNAAGKRGKCPKCGAQVQIPAADIPGELEPIPVKPIERAAPQRAYPAAIATMPASVVAGPPVPTVNVTLPRRGSSLGIAACILGILAFVICWVPLLGLVGVPLSALGLILGVIGLLTAIFRRGSGIGFPIAGTAISALALFVAIASTVVTGKALEAGATAMSDAVKQAEKTNQQVVPAAAARPTTKPGAARIAQPKPPPALIPPKLPDVPAPTPAKAPEPPPLKGPAKGREPEEQWASATDTVKQGDVEVRITSVFVGKVPLRGFGDSETTSTDPLLAIEVLITNTGANKKIQYSTFMGRGFSIGRDFASLRDNFDNIYKRIDFGMSKPIGGNESESIYPGKAITDVLVFELPVDTTEHLDLQLPAQSFGGTGMLRIRIPATIIQKR